MSLFTREVAALQYSTNVAQELMLKLSEKDPRAVQLMQSAKMNVNRIKKERNIHDMVNLRHNDFNRTGGKTKMRLLEKLKQKD